MNVPRLPVHWSPSASDHWNCLLLYVAMAYQYHTYNFNRDFYFSYTETYRRHETLPPASHRSKSLTPSLPSLQRPHPPNSVPTLLTLSLPSSLCSLSPHSPSPFSSLRPRTSHSVPTLLISFLVSSLRPHLPHFVPTLLTPSPVSSLHPYPPYSIATLLDFLKRFS